MESCYLVVPGLTLPPPPPVPPPPHRGVQHPYPMMISSRGRSPGVLVITRAPARYLYYVLLLCAQSPTRLHRLHRVRVRSSLLYATSTIRPLWHRSRSPAGRRPVARRRWLSQTGQQLHPPPPGPAKCVCLLHPAARGVRLDTLYVWACSIPDLSLDYLLVYTHAYTTTTFHGAHPIVPC